MLNAINPIVSRLYDLFEENIFISLTHYANRITRSLMQYAYLLTEHGVVVESYRTGGKRYIEITYKEDNCDGSDGRKGMPVSVVTSVSENPQPLSQSGNASVTVEDNNTKM